MSLAQSRAVLGIAADAELRVPLVLRAYQQREAELRERVRGADWTWRADESTAGALAKQAERQAAQAALDELWAAALHLETALHLAAPGVLCGPLGLSLLEPNPSSWRQALLLHLLRAARQQRLAWTGDGAVYALIPAADDADADQNPWRPHRAVAQGSLEAWLWRCCDKELHYRLWALLVEHGTSALRKLLRAQPDFPQLWPRRDAWQCGALRVYLAAEQRWADGVAEQALPDAALAVDGDAEFWATALGWPLRGVARQRFDTSANDALLDALSALADPSLPLRSVASWPAAPTPLVDRAQQAVALSFELDQRPHGPLDRYLS
jgi:hypothetical protein